MIITITELTPKLSIRLNTYGREYRVTNWKEIQLVISPLPGSGDCAGFVPLSPWYFYGCWPGVRTGVDVNASNGGFDFSPIIYDAFECDPDGRIVFLLDDRMWSLPHGRYHGMLRSYPARQTYAVCAQQGVWPSSSTSLVEDRSERRSCILSCFDIDYGPICVEHFIDQIKVDMALQEEEE